MAVRYYLDPETGEPHIRGYGYGYGHGDSESEVGECWSLRVRIDPDETALASRSGVRERGDISG